MKQLKTLHLLKHLRKFSRKKNHDNQCQGFLHFFVIIIIIIIIITITSSIIYFHYYYCCYLIKIKL